MSFFSFFAKTKPKDPVDEAGSWFGGVANFLSKVRVVHAVAAGAFVRGGFVGAVIGSAIGGFIGGVVGLLAGGTASAALTGTAHKVVDPEGADTVISEALVRYKTEKEKTKQEIDSTTSQVLSHASNRIAKTMDLLKRKMEGSREGKSKHTPSQGGEAADSSDSPSSGL